MTRYSWQVKSDAFWSVPIEDDGLFELGRDDIHARTAPEPKPIDQQKAEFEARIWEILINDEKKILDFCTNNPDVTDFRVNQRFFSYSFAFHWVPIVVSREPGLSFFTVNWFKIVIDTFEEFIHKLVVFAYIKSTGRPTAKVSLPDEIVSRYRKIEKNKVQILGTRHYDWLDIKYNKRMWAWGADVPYGFKEHFRALAPYSDGCWVRLWPLLQVLKNNLE